MSEQMNTAQLTRASYEAMRNQGQASNALGGLGVQQGEVSCQDSNAYDTIFNRAVAASGSKVGTQLRIRMPDSYSTALHGITEPEELIQAKQTICRLTMERDEALHTVSQLAARVTEAHREIGRLLTKYKYEVAATAEDSKPDASRIWEAIVAYSSR